MNKNHSVETSYIRSNFEYFRKLARYRNPYIKRPVIRYNISMLYSSKYRHPKDWLAAIKSGSEESKIILTYNKLPDNHTVVVITAGNKV